ncbi:hypothetical protein SPF06_06355 [Sinomonas sp. JGH33]|uniref:Twin transmembrane helix small protein n=1 Tax=Sinomonas terricola TaxID=3110330 RepID=A0ABU5T3T8_9MICC|nr:hypothetical protein [Sinomonas sp. JGH33]MEA5454338.1 hypothetical protein [Sinomonas sp. JGH33]
MIDWAAFFVVAAATILGAGSIVLFFSLGVRLGAGSRDPYSAGRRRLAILAASRICYALSGIAVLFGVYLVVPYFHH